MEDEALNVYERALLFLYQARLEAAGIKAELKVVKRDSQENERPVRCFPA